MERTVSQTFSDEDFVQITKDTEAQLEQINNQIDQQKEQLEDILENKEQEMGVLHAILQEEDYEGDVELAENTVDEDSLQQYQQVQDLHQQIQQMENQRENIKRQLNGMKDVAETIVEQKDDLTLEREVEKKEEKIETEN